MKRILFIVGIVIVVVIVGVKFLKTEKIISPLGTSKITQEKKLDKYSYDALRKRRFSGSKIIIDKIIKDGESSASYLFYFFVNGKKVSGLMNLPKVSGNYPLIIMIRGYIDKEIYQSGAGTSHGAEVLAENGFITLAPDFLGYGYSDPAVSDPMEDRFLTYVSILELANSAKNLNSALEKKSLTSLFDDTHLGIWGHSNGGQIALSVLEISGEKYPTVLWAPVSKPFPYSILYYTDDIDDHGRALRRLVAGFEKDYDAEKYSLTNYLDWIKAPLQIHQGAGDESVPQKWSDDLVEALKKKEKDMQYFTYPGDDHNFSQGSWNLVIQRTISFYKNLMLY